MSEILETLKFLGSSWLNVAVAVDEKLEKQTARIAELEAALASARREGMEEAAKIAESEPELHDQMPAEFEKYSRETLARASCIATKRAIAAAIRAALEGKQ